MKFLITLGEAKITVSAKDKKDAALKAISEHCESKILNEALQCKHYYEIKSLLFDYYYDLKIEEETPSDKYIIAYWSRCCAWLSTTAESREIAFALRKDFGNSTGVSFDDPMTATVYVAPWPLKGKSY